MVAADEEGTVLAPMAAMAAMAGGDSGGRGAHQRASPTPGMTLPKRWGGGGEWEARVVCVCVLEFREVVLIRE